MKKKFNQVVLLCYTSLLLLLANMANAQSDFTTIINNITLALKNVGGTYIANTATNYMSIQNPDGSWPDIAYATGASGDVPFSTHLTRLFQYSQAYTISTSPLLGDANLYNHLSLAIEYWNSHIHNASNWWYDQINYPQLLGQTMILMRGGSQSLSVTDSTNAMNYLASRENPSARTGANRLDEALHWLYRGALTANSSVLNTAVTQAGSTLELVSSGSEGINYDYSFLQHGPELMTMAYGSILLTDAYKIAGYIQNTSYSFTSSQMQNAYLLLHHTYNGAVRGRYKDFSLTGRGISRANELSQNQSITILAMKADASHYAVLRDDSLRLSGAQPPNYNISTPYHLHYWAGDYTLHNRPNYSFSVRNVSTRTARSESINGENLLGTFLTEGATNIRVNGNEYYNIFPVWDWDLIPGVTMRQFTTSQTNPNGCCSSSYWGNQAYVGGVSDSAYGCSANYMDYYNVTAKKAWFFFDDEVVCLGAGISSSSTENVATSINQCLLDGNISVNSGGNISTLGAHTQTTFTGNLLWALHDSVGYFFPAAGNIIISNQSQTGSWRIINTGGSASTLTKDVFKMWVDQGTSPTNGTYTYIVVPNMTTTTQMVAYNQANIKVITNTVSYQAVKHEGLKMLQAIIRATGGGTITDSSSGLTITVDKPCAVMVKNIGNVTVDVSIADPAQTATLINVGITFPGSGNVIPVAVVMPTGNSKGSSVAFQVSASYPYCAASGGINGTDRYINSLSTTNAIHDISFTGGSYPVNGYGLYPTDTIRVIKGTSFTLNMVNSASTKWSRVKVYADWNGSNDFTTVGDTVLSLGAANQDNSTTVLNINNSIAVPSDASIGNTRMRVRFFDAANNDPGPCGQSDYTTIQDFCLRIMSPIAPDSIIATEDSYVRDGTYANSNFGTSTSLQLKNDISAGYTRQVYLKFDLQNVPRPVTNAKLRLKIASAGVTANTTQWAVNQCSNNTWTETGITWNNKPATGVQVAIIQGQPATGLIEWDITSAVNAATSDLLTLQIASTITGSTTDATFSSSEIATSVYKPVIKFIYGATVTDSLPVVADAFVKSGTANENVNFGLNGYLVGQNGFYESYLRFDLHGLPSGMITAKLRLYSLAGASTQWQLYRVNDNNWTETGITWLNKPSAGTLLSTITAPSSAGYVHWDIFNELKYNMPADSIISVKISASANVYSSFASKQAGTVNQRPVIVFDTPVQQIGQLALPGGAETRWLDHPLTDNKACFIKIYPNPVLNKCLIQSKENIRCITIYNVAGESIKNIAGLNTLQYDLSLKDVKSGIYIIRVNGDNWTVHEKIIKQQD